MAVADTAVLAKQVDGTLLVVDSGATLKQVGANVLGVVLNKISVSSGGYYYYSDAHSGHGSDSNQGKQGGRGQGIRGIWDRVCRKSGN